MDENLTLTIKRFFVYRQRNGVACGAHAIAHAYHILEGEGGNPRNLCLVRQLVPHALYNHLINCYQQQEITAFPVAVGKHQYHRRAMMMTLGATGLLFQPSSTKNIKKQKN